LCNTGVKHNLGDSEYNKRHFSIDYDGYINEIINSLIIIESKNKQIEATKWWIKMFYPPSNNMYQTNKELIDKLIKTTIEKNNQEKEKFLSTFI
jgi:hypothetical protein